MTLTRHAAEDRMNRLLYISKHVGFGEEHLILHLKEEDRTYVITTTGVLFVKSFDCSILITAYLVSIDQAYKYYKLAGQEIPSYIKAKIHKNKVYIAKQNKSKGY